MPQVARAVGSSSGFDVGDRQDRGHRAVQVLARTPYERETLPTPERDLAPRDLEEGLAHRRDSVLHGSTERETLWMVNDIALSVHLPSSSPIARACIRVGWLGRLTFCVGKELLRSLRPGYDEPAQGRDRETGLP